MSRVRPRQLQPRHGQLHRQLRPGEALQRRVQAAARVALPAGDADPSPGKRGSRREVRPALRAGELVQSLRGPVGAVEVALGEVDLDEQREQRALRSRLANRGTSSSAAPVRRSSRSRASAVSPRARWRPASVRAASGCWSSPSRSCPASSSRPCRRRRSARRISAAARRAGMPRSNSRADSTSWASASSQRPAAVRMPP